MTTTSDNHTERPLGFETDFVFADSDAQLGIQNEGRVNRALATQETIGRTGYSAYVRHVQYGTYQSRPACLVGIDIAFRFPTRSGSRFSSAVVEVTFEKALDVNQPLLHSTDASLDPIVANFAPKDILGQVKEQENKATFELEIPVVFNVPFGSVGITSKWSRETTTVAEGRLEVHGNLAQDDEHDDGANSVTWDMDENPIAKGGEAIWMDVSIKPVVKFSLDPRRLVTKRLVREKDEPVYLDGHKMLGDQNCLLHKEFDSDGFPWKVVLNLPAALAESQTEPSYDKS